MSSWGPVRCHHKKGAAETWATDLGKYLLGQAFQKPWARTLLEEGGTRGVCLLYGQLMLLEFSWFNTFVLTPTLPRRPQQNNEPRP